MTRLENEPPGWSELCAKLRIAKDADEFRIVVDGINRLLTAHENAHPETSPKKAPTPIARKSERKRTGS
jgi:hypothetical protein